MTERASDTATVTATFLFADVAGFTALTEAHGDHEAAALVADFCAAIQAELPASGGTQVKTDRRRGDAGHPRPGRGDPPGAAHHTRSDARARRAGRPRRPASGPGGRARRRLLRSRGQPRGTCLGRGERWRSAADGQTAALAPQVEGVLYEPRGRRTLRNIGEPVELVAAVRAGESSHGSLPCDPVCRMAVDPERAAGRLVYAGTAAPRERLGAKHPVAIDVRSRLTP
jgi:adenylate cyclase